MPQVRRSPPRVADLDFVPFNSAEEAWFWSMAGLQARDDGARPIAGMAIKPRPCDPDDLLLVLRRLHQRQRVSAHHVRVLMDYGRQQMPPDGRCREEALDARLWDEALDLMVTPLRRKGIIL
jgi:hypothetical protein